MGTSAGGSNEHRGGSLRRHESGCTRRRAQRIDGHIKYSAKKTISSRSRTATAVKARLLAGKFVAAIGARLVVGATSVHIHGA